MKFLSGLMACPASRNCTLQGALSPVMECVGQAKNNGQSIPLPSPPGALSKLVCVPSPIAVAVSFQTIKASLSQVEEAIVLVPAGPMGVFLTLFIPLANNT